jgi:hypothetical protein
MSERPKKPTVGKARFEQIVGALTQVGKEEADVIMEADKKPLTGKKRGRKPTPEIIWGHGAQR